MSGFDLIIQPDVEEPEAAEILVDGAVGGRPYRFLLDTGAARSSILLDDYTAGFDSLGKHSSSGVFAAGSRDLIRVPVIALGPITRRDFTLTRIAEKDSEMRNLIGMDLLKDHCLHFFFDENRVAVDPEVEAGRLFQDLFLDQKFHPYVEVQFGGRKASAVWDTGAGITIVDLGLIEQNPAFFQEAGRSAGTDSTGATNETPMYLMSSAVTGRQAFPAHRVAGVDLSHLNPEAPVDLILGYNTMRQANWWFDFPGKRWGITKMLEG
ncbi:MAG: hypothetical protein EHM21_19160 [Chloroflexi bacterium]|nr:MAG: hypothetical protein EHM21_19160 [Chloroflexota bacterium]